MNTSMGRHGAVGAQVATLSEASWIRFAGWAGIAVVILDVVAMGFNLAAGQPPNDTDASRFTSYIHSGGTLLTMAGLLFTLSFTMGMAFVVGIRELIALGGGAWRSVANLFLIANAVAYAVGYVAIGLLIASVTEGTTKGDPAVVRALYGGGFSVLGAVNYAELVLAVAIYGFAVGRTGFLPRWTGFAGLCGGLSSGAAIFEQIFSGTGIGRLIIDSAFKRDFPVILAARVAGAGAGAISRGAPAAAVQSQPLVLNRKQNGSRLLPIAFSKKVTTRYVPIDRVTQPLFGVFADIFDSKGVTDRGVCENALRRRQTDPID